MRVTLLGTAVAFIIGSLVAVSAGNGAVSPFGLSVMGVHCLRGLLPDSQESGSQLNELVKLVVMRQSGRSADQQERGP